MLRSNKAFLNKTCCFHGLYGGDSALFRLGVAKIGFKYRTICCPECIVLAGMGNDLYWRKGYWPME